MGVQCVIQLNYVPGLVLDNMQCNFYYIPTPAWLSFIHLALQMGWARYCNTLICLVSVCVSVCTTSTKVNTEYVWFPLKFFKLHRISIGHCNFKYWAECENCCLMHWAITFEPDVLQTSRFCKMVLIEGRIDQGTIPSKSEYWICLVSLKILQTTQNINRTLQL